MKIEKIRIKNFRSIKDDLIIDGIGDCLILTGENNSGKSSIINALAVFLGVKNIGDKDFYNGTNEVEIEIIFTDISDDFLGKFVVFKKTANETRKIEQENPDIFDFYTKNKIDKKEDLETEEQINFIKNEWIENFKHENCIINGKLGIILKINIEDKKSFYSLDKVGGIRLEKSGFLPNLIFIDDERNFTNEQDGKTGSITQQIFGGIELKKDEDVNFDNLDILIKQGGKGVRDLDVHHLEELLQSKIREKSCKIGEEITNNFCNYYEKGFEIKINAKTDINHKTFSLSTNIIDPNIGEIPLNNVGAGLRSLYLLSLLKAYNDFSKNEHTIFIIEEPELYLHPGLQKKMAEILEEISNEQQLFFTTHSPVLLKKFGIESIKQIKKLENKTIKEDGDFNKILNNLGYSIFDIIKYKYILFVEGRDDFYIFKKIIDKFYPTKKDEVEIITSNGCDNLAFYASLQFLGLMNNSDKKYLIIRDGDNKINKNLISDFTSKLESKNFNNSSIQSFVSKLKILDRYSIENFFFNTIKIKNYFDDFNINAFINAFDNSESFIKEGDSIKKGNEESFKGQLNLLREDFDENIKKIRGHNVFNGLIYYINGEEIRYYYDKEKKKDFIDNYINNSFIEDFGVIKDYLDELFIS